MNGNVYHAEGVSPMNTTNKGEGNKIAVPILTPDRVDKQQNRRRFKNDGDEMFTITAQGRHVIMVVWSAKKVCPPTLMTIKGATKKLH